MDERRYDDLVEEEADGDAATAYMCLKGRVNATPVLVRDLLVAGFVSNLVYNPTIDRHAPVAAGVDHRIALSEARREGRPLPPDPERADRFLPVPDKYELYEDLTVLRTRHPLLNRFPLGILRDAVAAGCKAVEKYVADCVKAKASGSCRGCTSARCATA